MRYVKTIRGFAAADSDGGIVTVRDFSTISIGRCVLSNGLIVFVGLSETSRTWVLTLVIVMSASVASRREASGDEDRFGVGGVISGAGAIDTRAELVGDGGGDSALIGGSFCSCSWIIVSSSSVTSLGSTTGAGVDSFFARPRLRGAGAVATAAIEDCLPLRVFRFGLLVRSCDDSASAEILLALVISSSSSAAERLVATRLDERVAVDIVMGELATPTAQCLEFWPKLGGYSIEVS